MANQFFLDLFVVDTATDRKLSVQMLPATAHDIDQTRTGWQTYWGTPYMKRADLTNYALKSLSGELIALASYEVLRDRLVVHIVYMESQPESNPTIHAAKKYSGIGKAIVAYGIKLSPELMEHYVRDFGGIVLPNFGNSVPSTVLIADHAAVRLVADYLEKGGEAG